jgi:hypothetical protein
MSRIHNGNRFEAGGWLLRVQSRAAKQPYMTETEDMWVLVTREHLLSLAELGLRHVDDLTSASQ